MQKQVNIYVRGNRKVLARVGGILGRTVFSSIGVEADHLFSRGMKLTVIYIIISTSMKALLVYLPHGGFCYYTFTRSGWGLSLVEPQRRFSFPFPLNQSLPRVFCLDWNMHSLMRKKPLGEILVHCKALYMIAYRCKNYQLQKYESTEESLSVFHGSICLWHIFGAGFW